MTETLAALIPAASLFLYSLLFSIECGGALLMQSLPRWEGTRTIKSYLGPVWETTNVFLVFAIVALIAFFPGAVATWGTKLVVVFLLFLIAMGLRVIGMLSSVYAEKENAVGKLSTVIGNLAAPAILVGGAVPFILTGRADFSWLSVLFGALAVSISLALGYLFFDYLARRNGPALAAFAFTAAAFGVGFFWSAFRILPYLIYPSATIFNSFTDPASAAVLFWIFVIGAVIIIPSLFLLYRMALRKNSGQ